MRDSMATLRPTHPQTSNNNNTQAPPQWTPYTTYNPGNAVWFSGTFWRCEVGHTSGQGPSGAVRVFPTLRHHSTLHNQTTFVVPD